MLDFRTDLADERKEIVKKYDKKHKDIDGIESISKNITSNLKINIVKILNEKGSKKLDKKIGTYTTIDIKDIDIITKDELEQASDILKNELRKLIKKDDKSILVVGLGNEDTTADSMGPKVIKDLEITRHIIKYKPELLPKGTREISAISPGVLGNTGIETQEIVKSIVDKIKPSAIIVIDALMSTDISRLLRTIQISDTGITPGAGVGNKRKAINQEEIGVPVISIGVPTIVDAATIVANSIDIMIEKINEFANKDYKTTGEFAKQLKYIKEASYSDKYRLVKDVLEPAKYNLAVMPKDIDALVDNMKTIISSGINMVLKN